LTVDRRISYLSRVAKMGEKPRFRFSQANWVTVAVFALIPVLVGNILKETLGLFWGYGLGILIGLVAVPILGKFLMSYVEYYESGVIYKPGRLFSKQVKFEYNSISEVRYLYGRFVKLQIGTEQGVVEVPPPVSMEKARELTDFLVLQNPGISVELISKKDK